MNVAARTLSEGVRIALVDPPWKSRMTEGLVEPRSWLYAFKSTPLEAAKTNACIWNPKHPNHFATSSPLPRFTGSVSKGRGFPSTCKPARLSACAAGVGCCHKQGRQTNPASTAKTNPPTPPKPTCQQPPNQHLPKPTKHTNTHPSPNSTKRHQTPHPEKASPQPPNPNPNLQQDLAAPAQALQTPGLQRQLCCQPLHQRDCQTCHKKSHRSNQTSKTTTGFIKLNGSSVLQPFVVLPTWCPASPQLRVGDAGCGQSLGRDSGAWRFDCSHGNQVSGLGYLIDP